MHGQIELVVSPMQRNHVFSDRERHARATHLDRMHVAVDPCRGARAVRVLADLEQPQLAALDALADALHAHQAGIRFRPVVDDASDLFVAQVVGAKWAHSQWASESRPMMPSVRKASASPAMSPPPMSEVVSMSCGWPRSASFLL